MKEKFLQLMQNEHLTAKKLAEILDVEPALISHMRSGRNKPSFAVTQKILRAFPHLNPDWLLLDSPQMYREEYAAAKSSEADNPQTTDMELSDNASLDNRHSQPSQNFDIPELQPTRFQISDSRAGSTIEKIIILYSDGHFVSYDK